MPTETPVLNSLAPQVDRPASARLTDSRQVSKTAPWQTTKLDSTVWVRTCREFLKYHRRPLNVAMHLVTTPVGLIGLLALFHSLSPPAAIVVATVYAIALGTWIPRRAFLATSAALTVMMIAVWLWNPGMGIAIGMLVSGYVGQELAHLIAGEQTLQSSYSGQPQGWRRFVEHTCLLLPVLLVIAARHKQSPLRMFVARNAILVTKLVAESQVKDLQRIRDWVHDQSPARDQSTHWWQSELPDTVADAFHRLSHDPSLISMIRRFHGTGYAVQPVLGMNELYVTGPPKQCSSDSVFYRAHVDGPGAVFPGATLYRCMVAASSNAEVTTHFPMSGTDFERPAGYRLEHGDAVAFDFNRELHFITRETAANQTQPRINLKLHFVAYPRACRPYGQLLARLITTYDIRARQLFLNTISPDRIWSRIKADWVLRWTRIFECVVRYVGWTNLAYLCLVGLFSLSLRQSGWWLAGTSFVHYFIYLGTFRERTAVSFGTFRRDALLFKTLSMAQLGLLYIWHFDGNLLSLGLVGMGFAIASYATAVLGINRTLFAAELGFDSSAPLRRGPYRILSHPMIQGAMLGLGAMLLVDDLRTSYGWLILGHLVGYLAVLTQEMMDANRRRASQVQALADP